MEEWIQAFRFFMSVLMCGAGTLLFVFGVLMMIDHYKAHG
jgi:hypothetical protein